MSTFALYALSLFALALFVLEHVIPAHPIKPKLNWYIRAGTVTAFQLFVVMAVENLWQSWNGGVSLFHLGGALNPWVGSLLAYFIFTFVVYWWHRLRHSSNTLWRVFHQFHHSPERIQTLTAYYMHPLDMFVSLTISNIILFPLLGLGADDGAIYTLITGAAGLLIHANIKLPRKVGYVFQTPEMHRLHHKRGHHKHNFSDITWWDMMFGTYLNPHESVAQCGFSDELERDLVPLLLGRKLPNNKM
jgi:sterol desaturase/sphingolipid hydroxylase (fatty acid hydroxylase superfamily)